MITIFPYIVFIVSLSLLASFMRMGILTTLLFSLASGSRRVSDTQQVLNKNYCICKRRRLEKMWERCLKRSLKVEVNICIRIQKLYGRKRKEDVKDLVSSC